MDNQYYSQWESIANHALKRVEELEKEIEKLKQEPGGDLISRDAVLDTIHRFFTEEVDKIPTKKTEDGEVYVIHKCQPLFEMNKAICKRIKALPSASPTQNCVGNALDALDCIRRDAVLDTLDRMNKALDEDRTVEAYIDLLRECYSAMPSVNPQEKIGHWINITKQNLNDYRTGNKLCFECDQCHHQFTYSSNFCPDCGSKND